METPMITTALNNISRRQNENMLSLMLERITAKTKRRVLRKTLLNMDDHMLRDIGLTHSVYNPRDRAR
jgi:uncharacterized protein YjiS (DUF1127 family)